MRRRERGSITVEMGLAMPVLLLVILMGFQFMRVLVTRHRLADATTYAARAAAIAGDTTGTTITSTVTNRMGSEMARCASLSVTAQIVPGPYVGAQALQVQSVCNVAPLFRVPLVAGVGPNTLTVVAVMPL